MSVPDPTASAQSAELVDALVRTSFVTMAVLTRVGAEHELSLTQLRVLAILRDRRPRMAELARYLGLDRSSMSGLVDRAEARGLLRRAPNPDDRRAVDVFLTADGLELATRMYDEVARSLAPMLHALGRADRARLQKLLADLFDGSS